MLLKRRRPLFSLPLPSRSSGRRTSRRFGRAFTAPSSTPPPAPEALNPRSRSFGAFRADPGTDVLVLGDSRIYSGLDPAAAATAAGMHLRFLNAGVPGTTPRCWPFFVRAIDPRADRFKAVVIPVDTYADDDSAIGSLDGDDRPMDLRYVVFQTRLSDLPKLAGSFSDPRERVEHGIDLFCAVPELRDDVQNLLADPPARAARSRGARRSAVRSARRPSAPGALAGLSVDFAQRLGIRAGSPTTSTVQSDAGAREAKPSASYALYRLQWLEPIAARYRAAGVRVFFVRIPTRPAHRVAPGSERIAVAIAQIAGRGVHSRRAVIALERPELSPTKITSTGGSLHFSRLLGRDVADVLTGRARLECPRRRRPQAPSTRALRPSRRPRLRRPPRRRRDRTVRSRGMPRPPASVSRCSLQSYEFWLFFAIVAAIFYLLPRRRATMDPAARELLFLRALERMVRLFLWILTASDYASRWLWNARESERPRPRALLALGVAANLAFLGTFKYANSPAARLQRSSACTQNP